MFEIDELELYAGCDVKITDKIIVTQPSLLQIREFGERRYFSAVQTLTSVGADLKWQLMDYYKIDYTTIEDYDLFIKLVCRMVSSKKKLLTLWQSNPEQYHKELSDLDSDDIKDMIVNPLQLTLKDIDLADFDLYKSNIDNEMFLYNKEKDITINRLIYNQIVDVVRKIHGFKRNNEIPGNEATKQILIEDAREEAMLSTKKPYKSILKPLISALSVSTGQCGDDRIWNMKINMFFDNIKRTSKIQDAHLLLQGAYSGFSSLKGIDKSRLDWAGDI